MKKGKKLIVILLSLLFITLTILVKLDLTTNFDTNIYKLVTCNMNDTLNNIFKFITFFGSTLFIIFLVIFFLIIFIIKKDNKKGYLVAFTLVISTILNNLVKIIIRRARPTVLALVTETTFSFPSGHMMASVSMYGILLYLVIKSKINKTSKIILSIFLGILPLLVGISRIYLGAHFATDIIGGMLLSTIMLMLLTNYIDKKESL